MGHQENKCMLYSTEITLNNDNQIEKIIIIQMAEVG